MARPEVIGRKTALPDAADDVDAFSIEEFCRRHGFSPQLFYKFRKQMPATFGVGSRVLISREAAAAWRQEREQATAAAKQAMPVPHPPISNDE
jgi:hypothetical protein